MSVICLHSQCDKVLSTQNRNGWCSSHRYSKERRQVDSEWRESVRAYQREHASNYYRQNHDYRNRQLQRKRKRYATDAKYRNKIKAKVADRARDRFKTEQQRELQREYQREYSNRPEVREHRRLKARERRHRLGGGRKHRRYWRQLNEKQSNRCALCNELMGADVTVDHIVPVSRGGGNEPENLQAAHRACNTRKGKRYDLFAIAGF